MRRILHLAPRHRLGPVVSFFSGCGGLDAGFESEGFQPIAAVELRRAAVDSYNQNLSHKVAKAGDVKDTDLRSIAKAQKPTSWLGVIGGPPCQSFSRSNTSKKDEDLRSDLVEWFIDATAEISNYHNVAFFVMENVPELATGFFRTRYETKMKTIEDDFHIHRHVLDAADFGVPQHRRRLFTIGISKKLGPRMDLIFQNQSKRSVYDAIGNLPDPIWFENYKKGEKPTGHPNHICMTPRSKKFTDGSLQAGETNRRSFKTLAWEKPSVTCSYGHREVHVHPSGRRRLSVYEAMKLQSFPDNWKLKGNLSDQISQVSEAVPPPMSKAVAGAIIRCLRAHPVDLQLPLDIRSV